MHNGPIWSVRNAAHEIFRAPECAQMTQIRALLWSGKGVEKGTFYFFFDTADRAG